MKKTMLCLIAVLFAGIALVSVSYAVPAASKALSVNVTVPIAPVPDIDIAIYSGTNADLSPATGTPVSGSTLSFGSLEPGNGATAGNGVWYSKRAFCVQIFMNGYGLKYEVRSTCVGIGTISNTNKYLSLTAVYSPLDEYRDTNNNIVGTNGNKPTGALVSGVDANVGPTMDGIGTNKVIYTSELAPSTAHIVQAYYGIPQMGATAPFAEWTGIPLSQAANTYTGTITLSIVAI